MRYLFNIQRETKDCRRSKSHRKRKRKFPGNRGVAIPRLKRYPPINEYTPDNQPTYAHTQCPMCKIYKSDSGFMKGQAMCDECFNKDARKAQPKPKEVVVVVASYSQQLGGKFPSVQERAEAMVHAFLSVLETSPELKCCPNPKYCPRCRGNVNPVDQVKPIHIQGEPVQVLRTTAYVKPKPYRES